MLNLRICCLMQIRFQYVQFVSMTTDKKTGPGHNF